ncbi:MAG: DUF3575 domain-containing protein [Bacteroidetes bacterium]|nr:DUF3575 domain-containing protein [Bacteroidota bacterium]
MKKLIFTLCVCAFTTAAMAQDGETGKNVVKLNPLGLLFGSANASYERALNEKSSVQVDAAFGALSVGGVKYTNLGGAVEYKYYLSKSAEAPKGFYVAPGAGFYSLKVKTIDGESITGSGFVGKGLVGKQWIWNSGFVVDLFGGINYYAGGKIKDNTGAEYTKFSGVLPAVGVSLGFNF